MQAQLRDMEYFAAVAEHGQVQRAAAALGLSQPALSKSLRRLEQVMNTKLVRRTPKGVELTTAGSALLAQIRKLRLSLDDVTREISELSLGRAGHLRIGAGDRYALDLMPVACAALLKDAPRVTISVSIGSSDIIATALLRGELELSVTMNALLGYDGLEREHLLEEEVGVYASVSHRLAGKKQVTLTDLAQERWALPRSSTSTERLRQAFAERGLPPPKVAVETNAGVLRGRLLPMTDLLTFGPRQLFGERASRRRLVELPVKGLSSRQSVCVYYRKDAYLSPAARRFIEILKTTAKEISAGHR